jgi:hypothetical protein
MQQRPSEALGHSRAKRRNRRTHLQSIQARVQASNPRLQGLGVGLGAAGGEARNGARRRAKRSKHVVR